MILTREELLKKSKKIKKITIDGNTLYIKVLPASVILDLRNETLTENVYFKLVSLSVCDKEGNPILSEDDVKELDIFTLNSIAIEIVDLNKLNPEAVNKAREDLKNLKTEGLTTS